MQYISVHFTRLSFVYVSKNYIKRMAEKEGKHFFSHSNLRVPNDFRYRFVGKIPPFRRPRGRSGQFRWRYRIRLFAISAMGRRSSSLPSSSFSCGRSARCLFLTTLLFLLCPRVSPSNIVSQVCSLMKNGIKSVKTICIYKMLKKEMILNHRNP